MTLVTAILCASPANIGYVKVAKSTASRLTQLSLHSALQNPNVHRISEPFSSIPKVSMGFTYQRGHYTSQDREPLMMLDPKPSCRVLLFVALNPIPQNPKDLTPNLGRTRQGIKATDEFADDSSTQNLLGVSSEKGMGYTGSRFPYAVLTTAKQQSITHYAPGFM